MKKSFRIIAFIVAAGLHGACQGNEAPQPAGSTGRIVVISNDLCRLEFDAGKAGACTAYRVSDPTMAFDLAPGSELFQEVFTRTAMEKGFKAVEYKTQALEGGKGVVFSLALDAANADESVAGLQLKRVVTLPAGARHINVEQTLSNPTKDVMGAQMGVRSRWIPAGKQSSPMICLPTERNVQRIVNNSIDSYYVKNSDWDYEPVEGWLAAISENNNAGLVFVFEPLPVVDSFFNQNGGLVSGWFLDGGILNPGESFKTTCRVIPVHGFKAVAYASSRWIADIQVKPLPLGLEITHTLAGATAPLGEVRVSTVLYGARSKKSAELPSFTLPQVGLDPVQKAVTTDQSQGEPLVVRVRVSGKDWSESYEAYYEGKFPANIYPGYPWVPEYRRPKLKR